MKFFLDSANVKEIEAVNSWGMLDGVTTNPSLIAKEGRPFDDVVKSICKSVEGPVSLEALASDYQAMVREGQKLYEYGNNVVVKLPMSIDALKATKTLAKDGIPVNITLCFSPMQGLMAAKAGAAYISPFVGRLDDYAHDGMVLIGQLVEMFNNYDFVTEVLVASVRHPLHVVDSALMGADVATVPYKVMEQFSKHPLTDLGVKKFQEDWQKVPTR